MDPMNLDRLLRCPRHHGFDRGGRLPARLQGRPWLQEQQAGRTGLRVAAGYAWRLLVVAAAVYLMFVVLGRLQFVAVAVFVGLVLSALLRPLTDLIGRLLPRGVAVAASLLLAVAVLGGVFTFIAR